MIKMVETLKKHVCLLMYVAVIHRYKTDLMNGLIFVQVKGFIKGAGSDLV